MKMLCVAAGLWAAVIAAGAEATLGKGVTLKEATPIAALRATPDDSVGKTVRVDGVAKTICAAMGCWMGVAADESDPASPTVRLKVDHGGIVFPMTAKGKKVSAEGTFARIDDNDAEGKGAAAEHARQDPNASPQYQIKATGAIIQ
jgi:hypothetical protein